MSDTVAIPCAITVSLPRRLLNELASAVRQQHTGNFVVHIRAGAVLGFTFEQKHTLNEAEKSDEVPLPRRWTT